MDGQKMTAHITSTRAKIINSKGEEVDLELDGQEQLPLGQFLLDDKGSAAMTMAICESLIHRIEVAYTEKITVGAVSPREAQVLKTALASMYNSAVDRLADSGPTKE